MRACRIASGATRHRPRTRYCRVYRTGTRPATPAGALGFFWVLAGLQFPPTSTFIPAFMSGLCPDVGSFYVSVGGCLPCRALLPAAASGYAFGCAFGYAFGSVGVLEHWQGVL